MKESLSEEDRDAKVQADAAKISGGIETAVDTVAAVASLFVGSVRSTQQQSEQDSELQPPVSAAEQQATQPDGGAQRVGDGRRVVAVNRLAGPTRGGETGQLIVRGSERHRPIDGDAVVVEEDDQFRQLVMAGQ